MAKQKEVAKVKYALTRGKAPVYGIDMTPAGAKAVREYLSALGKKGGAATKGITSKAKKKASRANGKLGGRPRKAKA